MKILLGFFFLMFFGEDCEDDPKPNCEEWEVEDGLFANESTDGGFKVRPTGTPGIRVD